MDAQRREEITGWDAREFSDGFADLRRLVDRGFSGAVTDGAGWLFLFEGRVVGTVNAELDAFSDASGTIYRAPHEALPVLFAMQEQGGEPRAQYYTNDTPLSEADAKLSQGGFTGYVELSENVLSGDYYVTYTAGESMAAAYVGNSRRLETGDEAFELADDEVGIYTVYEVDLDVREIPSDDGTTAEETTGGTTTAEETTSGTTTAEETGDGAGVGTVGDADVAGAHHASETDVAHAPDEAPDEVDDAIESDPEPDASDVGDGPPATAADNGNGAAESDATPTSPSDADESPPSDADESPTSDVTGVNERGSSNETTGSAASTGSNGSAVSTGSNGSVGSNGPTGRAGSDEPTGSTEADDDASGVSPRAAGSSARRPGDADDSAAGPADEDVFSEEEQWREQKSIPALDPSRASDPPENAGRSAKARSDQRSRDGRPSGDEDRSAGTDATASEGTDRTPDPRSTEETTSSGSAVSQRSTETATGSDARKRIQELRTALEAAESERESLAARVDDIEAERDDVAAERDELAAEVDRLETELSTLREERDRFREELSAARERLPDAERSISAREARSGTNLFVRYDSKGGATLEDAHEGSVDRDMLRENLRIEHHTSFETDGLSVDGRPFEEFLEGTIEYGFTRWLVEDLPFEVSETGNQSVLRDLYDAIPEIDRAEIGGSVSIAIRENGEETREQRAFDLVLRDRMGNPLFIADLNDSRDPTAEGTLESLVGNGRDIAESNDSFAAAFAVTESFFEPGALETASDAVGGGLFSRSKRASFVKLSRKQGYHLCLVEARDGGFHMTVPDL